MSGVVQVPWTDEEREQLRRLHENALSQSQMARLLGRTKHSVHRQLSNMGLLRGDRTPIVKAHTGGHRPVGHPRAPKTTLPPLPSLMEEPDAI